MLGQMSTAEGGLSNTFQAAAQHAPFLFKHLLDNGADIHAIGGIYESTLHAAAYCPNMESIPLLLNHGGDIRTATVSSQMALT